MVLLVLVGGVYKPPKSFVQKFVPMALEWQFSLRRHSRRYHGALSFEVYGDKLQDPITI